MNNSPRTRLSPGQFLFGAAYYPEQDRAEDLRDDPDRLAAAGVNLVRMAEFAWDRLEPSPGEFDFSFFDEQIRRLGERGIRTMLCTPTAAPPVWLARRHPEILRVDADGRTQVHGSRQHASHCSPVFRAASRAITGAMAAHYAGNPHVVGWQTDNEFHCHFSEDYCNAAREGFREFLTQKYRDIAALNEAWGTAFWAQTYAAFAEVDLPYPNRPSQENPGQRLDYVRYLSHAVIEFQREQVVLLRAANPRWWITHNGIFPNIDYRAFNADLDFMGVDIYPLLAPVVEPGSTVPEAYSARMLARTQSLSPRFIVPELQSGGGAQGGFMTDTPEPGQMRLFAWHCVAHGALGTLHFRWRTCRFGAEEYWEGVLDHDNLPRRRYEEFCREGAEFKAQAHIFHDTRPCRDVGVLYDTGLMEFAHRPITLGLPSPGAVADTIFTTLWRAGYNVGYVHPLADLANYRLLFLGAGAVVIPEVAAALTAWVQRGGTLVILARSGRKDERGQVVTATPPGILAPLAGCEIEEYSRIHLPRLAGLPSTSFTWGGEECAEHLWREILRPRGGRVVAQWRGGRFEGLPAVVQHQVGAGTCFYIGTYPDERLVTQWIALLAPMAGIRPLLPELPEGVEVTLRREGDRRLLFILNHRGKPSSIRGVPEGTDLLTGRKPEHGALTLEPYGVVVLSY